MHRKPWFTIDSQYTANGIVVTFFDEKVNLTSKDVCYLLCEIDVHATQLIIPLETIVIAFYGHYFELTREQWFQFVKTFRTLVVQAGWSSDCCVKPKWLDDLIRNKQR